MTAKRFTIIYGVNENPFEWDIMDNKKDALICQSNGKPICDLLNELAEENGELKEESEVCKQAYDEIKSDAIHLKEENEHIKQTIRDMINTERTELGKMTLRHLWRQIQ